MNKVLLAFLMYKQFEITLGSIYYEIRIKVEDRNDFVWKLPSHLRSFEDEDERVIEMIEKYAVHCHYGKV